MYLLFVTLVLGYNEGATIPGALNGTLTLGYLLSWSHDWSGGPYIGSAIVVAIREIQQRQLLPGYYIDWILADTWCQSAHGVKAAIEVWSRTQDLDAFIGPSCSSVCQTVSLLSAAWNIPVVSYSCTSDVLSDKRVHPTFSRTVGLRVDMSVPLHQLALVFQWKRVGIISDTVELYLDMANEVDRLLEGSGVTTFHYITQSTVSGDQATSIHKMRGILHGLWAHCSVIYILMYWLDVRNLLAIAHEEDKLRGYIYVGPEAELPLTTSSSFHPELGNDLYEGVIDLQMMTKQGPEWDKFRQDIINSFQIPEFANWTHIGPASSLSTVNSFAGLIHDAVLMWAYGVNKSLEQGYGPDDGVRITNNIINMTFDGITGTVVIDEHGDRKMDYAINVLQNGQIVRIMEYFASKHDMVKLYKAEEPGVWEGIIWPGNSTTLPPNSPPCGWDNELCPRGKSATVPIAIVISVILALATLTLVIFFLRKQRLDKRMREAASCVVAWTDVQTLQTASTSSLLSQHPTVHHACNVVRYKSEMAVMKALGPKQIVMERQVLLEVKAMKDLNHDNINSFLGICVEQPHACILMAFASRGSLADVLYNSDEFLNWDLKTSVMLDIAKGMQVIHSAAPGWHGNLTSTNCVIDNRWICKITDYGLHYTKQASVADSKDPPKPESLLWTAPELLRTENCRGSKKGDVYSFGIICQEIVTDSPPFAGDYGLQASEIINQVKKGMSPPYRPKIPDETCPEAFMELIELCWAEAPDMRPHFSSIISKVMRASGGKARGLVDSMIARLENYSTKLETIVMDSLGHRLCTENLVTFNCKLVQTAIAKICSRSAELVEEKEKMEHLLTELLPRSITESLKLGQKVDPETFECVTVFFSDIVGFTRISAAGTPLDVVKMLNLMYTTFDDISSNFDVYKVATIGDAYFVASGVPLRNGTRHALEICSMALELLGAVCTLEVPHLLEETLRLRIGIHSGTCLAGVIGVKMPRYLLFGDTVDIASKLESSGASMRIQISQVTANLLSHPRFKLQQRDRPLYIKGIGFITTYWLTT